MPEFGLAQKYFRRPDFSQVNQFPFANIQFYAYGRQALAAAVSAIKLRRPIKSILMPDFICRDVLAPFNAQQIEIKFYSIDENFCANPEGWPPADIVLSVNYFGFAQPLRVVKAYCTAHSVPLIEDNAHGFLSKDDQGEWLGTRADFGIFSFRKTLPIGTGAGLFRAEQLGGSNNLPEVDFKSRLKLTMKDVLAKGVSSGVIPPHYLMRVLAANAITQDDQQWLTNLPDVERVVPENFAVNHARLERLRNLDIGSEASRRRDLYFALRELALVIGGLYLPFKELDEGTVPYMFVFIPESERSWLSFVDELRRRALRVVRWPDLPLELRKTCPAFYKNVWAVPFMW